MPKTEMLHIRVEPDIKQMADQTFRSLGLTTADAVNVFLRKSIDAGGFPFAVRRPCRAVRFLTAFASIKIISKKAVNLLTTIQTQFDL